MARHRDWLRDWLVDWADWFEEEMGHNGQSPLYRVMRGESLGPMCSKPPRGIDSHDSHVRKLAAAMNRVSERGGDSAYAVSVVRMFYLLGARFTEGHLERPKRTVYWWKGKGEAWIRAELEGRDSQKLSKLRA